MGEVAALSLIKLTRPRASAKACLGVSQPCVAETAPAMQQKQNRRRESAIEGVTFIFSSPVGRNPFRSLQAAATVPKLFCECADTKRSTERRPVGLGGGPIFAKRILSRSVV